MDLKLLFEIIQLTTGLAAGITNGTVQKDLNLAAGLEEIVSKAAEFHQTNVGTPLDPSALKYEERVQ